MVLLPDLTIAKWYHLPVDKALDVIAAAVFTYHKIFFALFKIIAGYAPLATLASYKSISEPGKPVALNHISIVKSFEFLKAKSFTGIGFVFAKWSDPSKKVLNWLVASVPEFEVFA